MTKARLLASMFLCGGLGCGVAPDVDSHASALVVQSGFRTSTMALRDPHVYAGMGPLCFDVTSMLNARVRSTLTGDGAPADGLYDLSLALVFSPLDPTLASTPAELHVADCTSATPSSCSPAHYVRTSTATNQSTGVCSLTLPSTLGPYSAPAQPPAPCFVTSPIELDLELSGVQIRLESTQVAAQYDGAARLVSGVMRGFLTEAAANLAVIPQDIPIAGGIAMTTLLPGGAGNCARHTDLDVGPDGVTPGWWMYFDFTSDAVTWAP